MRLRHRDIVAVAPERSFTFDGQAVPVREGESIAAALAASGHVALRRARDGAPRGLYCGMGACFECTVEIDGSGGQRACLTKARAGMVVRSLDHDGPPLDRSAALADPPAGPLAEQALDALVVGAGPAGLSAAIALAEAAQRARVAASVTVVDERPEPGGQFYKQLAATHRFAGEQAADRQFRDGAALIARARDLGIVILSEALVWSAFGPHEIAVLRDGAVTVLRPRTVIIAAGAYERPYPVPGWTLPGFMTTGAAQTLARSYRVAPGKRVVIAGNGPLNFQTALELARGGAEIAAVVEAASPGPAKIGAALRAAVAAPDLMGEGAAFLIELRRRRIPVLWGHAVNAAEGDTRVRGVTVARIDAAGRPIASTERSFAVDAVCVGYGFVPSSELARQLGCRHVYNGAHLEVARGADGATSAPGVFVVGDGGAIGGARVALAQGALAGGSAAQLLGWPEDVGASAWARRDLARARRFQKALWSLFAAPPVAPTPWDDATIVCRCEGVSAGELKRHIAGGVSALGSLKRLTRAGMGRCQGRYCSPTVARLLADATGSAPDEYGFLAPRAPLKPIPLAALAVEKPEWGGHRPAQAPELRLRLPEIDDGERQCDALVVGGGIVGSAAAYFLAREGVDVLLVERDELNGQASGANAGSLHVQLLCFDFGAKAQAGGKPAAETLPLGRDAVALWQELAATLAGAIEMQITGGLMVAENEAQLQFLRDKIACERSYGVEAHLLVREELRALAPNLADMLVGAEYCPAEGKINPLVATSALADAAAQAGARLLRRTEIRAIERAGAGFRAVTNRGTIRCGRIVNAAGAWSPRVAAMLGVELPVHGAPLQMMVTETGPALVKQLVMHADRHLSLKQAANGNVIIGGGWSATLDAERGVTANLRASLEGNAWVARRVLPALDRLHLLRSWSGMNVNIDGAPIVGPVPGAPGLVNAVTSNGYTLGPLVARLAVEMLLGRRGPRGLEPYLIERFGRR
jgi:glycine/D-amino acid oxidase-like deaminating enzyme